MGRPAKSIFIVTDINTGEDVMSKVTATEIAEVYNISPAYVRKLSESGDMLLDKYMITTSSAIDDFCAQWRAVTCLIKEHYKRNGGYVFARIPDFSR